MGTFLKQPRKAVKGPSNPKKPPVTEPVKVILTGPDKGYGTPSIQHDINHVAGLDGVEQSLDWIAQGVSALTSDDRTVGVSIGQNRYSGPVQLTLTDDDGNCMTERLVTAFERIADSVAKLAGLSRPRLESWQEQDGYEPRYKDIAVDGGAPGPKAP
jgi:hypothetical protein